MASLKNLFLQLSRKFSYPLPKSRTIGFFTLFLTLVLAMIFFAPLSNNSPAETSANLISHLHSASNYISSLSSVVTNEPHFILRPRRTPTGAVTFSAVESTKKTAKERPKNCAIDENVIGSCDFFYGHWVVDDAMPLYKPGSCYFIDDAFNCFKNGRPDSDYLRLRWKPHGCELPRFYLFFPLSNFICFRITIFDCFRFWVSLYVQV